MTVQLLIAGMNRTQYLTPVRATWKRHHPAAFASRIEYHDTAGLGMAAAIADAWRLALLKDWDYLLHTEEDMEVLATLPIDAAVGILDNDPTLANVVFAREPWSPQEYDAGSVIAASCAYDPDSEDCGTHTIHHHIFSLNPCLIPRRVVEAGWPVGNEAIKTVQCLRDGLRFAFYGIATDPPFIRHLGHERGAGWKL